MEKQATRQYIATVFRKTCLGGNKKEYLWSEEKFLKNIKDLDKALYIMKHGLMN